MPRGRKVAMPLDQENYDYRPALTPEARENQVISKAYDLAEKQIMEGTASAQVITHFLRLGSQKEKLERELLAERTKLAAAKTDAIDQARHIEELYENAVKAMREYSGHGEEEYDEEY